MTNYIRNYIDCLTGIVQTDEGNKAHFRKALQVEVDKITPFILECEAKGMKPEELSPTLVKEYLEMVNALK